MSSVLNKRKRSLMWRFFTPVDEHYAICNYCKQRISYKTSTTNLKKHMENKHPTINIYKKPAPEASAPSTPTTPRSPTPEQQQSKAQTSSSKKHQHHLRHHSIIEEENAMSAGQAYVEYESINFDETSMSQQQQQQQTHNHIQHHQNQLNNIDDNDIANYLGKTWASQYKEMNSKQKVIARKMFSDILYYGCLGHLDENHAHQLQENLSATGYLKDSKDDFDELNPY